MSVAIGGSVASSATEALPRPAPVGRADAVTLQRQQALVRSTPLLQGVIDCMEEGVLVLNEHRQIVACNCRAAEWIKAAERPWLGARPGEVLECIHAHAGPDGCGTGPYCITCGAVQAILESQQLCRPVVRECRLLCRGDRTVTALELKVIATPIDLQGGRVIVCAIHDVSKPKRLALLTRLFFHDVLNTAGGIEGYAAMLAEELRERLADDFPLRRLQELAAQLIEDLRAQRDLMYAESGDLTPEVSAFRVAQLLADLVALYYAHPAAKDRTIRVEQVWDGVLETDRRLLARVLGNMLKNALEATPAGGVVSLGCKAPAQDVVFWVRNPGVMPQEVQLQIFHRFFSTKGQPGRGIGTYSMKLLTEGYLGGQVAFTSTEAEGTVFTVTIPRHRRM